MKNIKEVCEFIWELESKYDLLDLDIGGVKSWQYKRMEIYYKMAQASGVLETPHIKMSKLDHLKSITKYIKNSIIRNPFFMPKGDVLIIPNERTKEYQNEQIDIYTHFLSEELRERGKIVLELERPYLGQHNKKTSNARYYADFIILLSNFFKHLIRLNLSAEASNVINQVELDINNKLGLDFGLRSQLILGAKRFKVNYLIYKKILEKTSVNKVYCIIGYSYGDLIKACKDCNVTITELQHGTFSKYHLGYSFPNRTDELDYFAEKFAVWNSYWKKMIKLPLSDTNIIIRPFDYLNILKSNYKHIKRVKNKVVVISQGALTEKIAGFILNNFQLFVHFQIHYKLHPGEFKDWRGSRSLSHLVDQGLVTLETSTDLYKLFSECEFQIGVFSTAIYEGAEFGCKSILLNLPGIEYMETFIKINNMTLTKGVFLRDD